MSEARTDSELLDRADKGDESSFQLLYHRHRDGIFRFVYRMLGSAELAEDVTHDCFLSLLGSPGRFNPERASLRTYLYAAARNLVWKNYRSRGRDSRTAIDDLEDELRLAIVEEPLQGLLEEELVSVVRTAVAGLESSQREALILFEYEEMTLAEIAVIVGTEPGTVKSRLHRARERLRTTLRPYLESGSRYERHQT
jgi:RNA polymerase sigma-70 factor (ECF subfamily)